MEWTYANRQHSQSLQEFFATEIDHEDDAKKFELLALSTVKRAVCYGAYRFTNKATGEERVSALVIPVKHQRGAQNIAFKVMTEYDCPLEHHHCPKKIYEMLTRFRHCEESPQAKEWRHRVETWHKRMDSMPPIRPGLKVVFETPVQFTNGDVQAEFTIETARPLLLRGNNDTLYRIRDLRDRIGRGDAQVVA
ncbi:MAG TPA: hypothetical protein VIQ01_02485 [Burkholderiales bacterium]